MEIQVNNFRMAYQENGEGQPLLLVHGYPLNLRLWQPQLDGLAGDAHVLAVDLRGHGDSQPVPGPYSMDLFADDLNAFLDAMGIEQPVVLGGLSMGGYAAFAFYRKYAHRLRGLILTATRSAPDSPEAQAARDQTAETARSKGIAAIVEAMAPKLLSPTNLQERPDLLAQVKQIMLKTSLEGVLGDLAAMKARPDSTPILAEMGLPVLILHGEEDGLIPVKEAQEMASEIRGGTIHLVPGAGHLPPLENPAVFNHAVREFLQVLPPL